MSIGHDQQYSTMMMMVNCVVSGYGDDRTWDNTMQLKKKLEQERRTFAKMALISIRTVQIGQKDMFFVVPPKPPRQS